MLWPTSKGLVGGPVLSPALLPRQPQAIRGWRSWQPLQLGATHMAVFDLFCGLVMPSGGFSLQIRWHQQLMLAWVVKPGYGGHRQGARNRFNSGSSS